MEVIDLQVLEVVGLVHRLEELAAQAGVGGHGAAGVEEDHDLHVVDTGTVELQAQVACVVAGLADGTLQVEHVHGAVLAGGHLTQTTEGQLEGPLIQHVVLTEVLELTLTGHLEGMAMLALAAHTDTRGGVAGVAHGGGAAGADPVLAAVVALVLFLQALLQQLPELFQVQGGAGVHLVLVVFLHVLGVVEPLHQLVGHVLNVLDPVKVLQEDLVELVKVCLGLHQNGPADVVELQKAVAAESPLQGLHEGEPLVHGHHQTPCTQEVE